MGGTDIELLWSGESSPQWGVSPKHRAELIMLQTPSALQIASRSSSRVLLNHLQGSRPAARSSMVTFGTSEGSLPVTVRPYRFCSIWCCLSPNLPSLPPRLEEWMGTPWSDSSLSFANRGAVVGTTPPPPNLQHRHLRKPALLQGGTWAGAWAINVLHPMQTTVSLCSAAISLQFRTAG